MNDDFEFDLFDRVNFIKDAYEKYDLENKSYISFSGGKDSTILSFLFDLAVPQNKIPRVFINTGIEYKAIVDFVHEIMTKDERFSEIKPSLSIVKMLSEKGYPFKSKEHSKKIGQWQRGFRSKTISEYRGDLGKTNFVCPKCLLYQFEDSFKIRLSDECCHQMKKIPAKKWEMENKREIAIIGLRMNEGGQRKNHSGCVVFKNGNMSKLKPLNPISDEFEKWVVEKYKIELCELYYPPFNFKRTGCKGCPFSIDLQEQLSIMERYMPNERKQCEIIWKPVYDEYRKIGFRLKENEQTKLF